MIMFVILGSHFPFLNGKSTKFGFQFADENFLNPPLIYDYDPPDHNYQMLNRLLQVYI